MTKKLLRFAPYLSTLLAALAAMTQTPPPPKPAGAPKLSPPPRAIPGITAKDEYPRPCVDCHLNYVEQKTDLRFSTLVKQWNEKVEPALLKKVTGSAPPGLTLKGKHPVAAGALRNIPAGCLPCHGSASKMAPSFARMMHAIHLTGGRDNLFLTLFQGECTHCHKLNAITGQWSLPSGPER
jgi:hypothetical protein